MSDGVNAYPVMREGGYFSVIIYFLHSTPEPLKGYFRAMQRATQQEGAFSLTPLAEAQDVAVAGTLAHMLELYNFPTPNCKVRFVCLSVCFVGRFLHDSEDRYWE